MKDYLMEYAGRADALLIAKFGKKSLETCQSWARGGIVSIQSGYGCNFICLQPWWLSAYQVIKEEFILMNQNGGQCEIVVVGVQSCQARSSFPLPLS